MIRRRYNVYGRVQGVGFRYTVRRAADVLGLTGWVRNEYDGTVTMELQGEQTAINRLFEALHRGTYIRIDGYDVTELETEDTERGFHVRG